MKKNGELELDSKLIKISSDLKRLLQKSVGSADASSSHSSASVP